MHRYNFNETRTVYDFRAVCPSASKVKHEQWRECIISTWKACERRAYNLRNVDVFTHSFTSLLLWRKKRYEVHEREKRSARSRI